MRWSVVLGGAGLAVLAAVASGEAQTRANGAGPERMNRMIPLIEQGLPILGLNNPPYAPGGVPEPTGDTQEPAGKIEEREVPPSGFPPKRDP